ncbi:MAG: hypothetical protein JSU69_07825 [Candidatus Zixiibacteriota bacterium]|nr:MAG: hypothetical protein JSU69_07825 [candidate division Zixibacteria bacterium]
MAGKTGSKKHKSNRKQDNLHREPISEHYDVSVTPFGETESLDKDKVFIECPGATVYDHDTRKIIAGVKFIDESDPLAGYQIIDHPVYAPEHRRRRLIKKEHRNLIRRCQACQDMTVRLMRREGPDFFIPNPKFPHKKQLKPLEKTW